jgi:hypothetical protein
MIALRIAAAALQFASLLMATTYINDELVRVFILLQYLTVVVNTSFSTLISDAYVLRKGSIFSEKLATAFCFLAILFFWVMTLHNDFSLGYVFFLATLNSFFVMYSGILYAKFRLYKKYHAWIFYQFFLPGLASLLIATLLIGDIFGLNELPLLFFASLALPLAFASKLVIRYSKMYRLQGRLTIRPFGGMVRFSFLSQASVIIPFLMFGPMLSTVNLTSYRLGQSLVSPLVNIMHVYIRKKIGLDFIHVNIVKILWVSVFGLIFALFLFNIFNSNQLGLFYKGYNLLDIALVVILVGTIQLNSLYLTTQVLSGVNIGKKLFYRILLGMAIIGSFLLLIFSGYLDTVVFIPTMSILLLVFFVIFLSHDAHNNK